MVEPIWSWKSARPCRFGIVVHGGAGNVASERRPRHVEGCLRAARAGSAILERGGSALDAVERAVRELEDDPVFNAGTGASLNSEGDVELDASIMDGRDLRAGAVCALRGFAAPVSIARAVLEDGRHVLFAADGAARFALEKGFARVDPAALVTEAAQAALRAARAKKTAASWAGGTVGAAARDANGSCAAATSTGGTVNKLPGRVGDSPIIGAGTCADDEAGAVSTTGVGEAMMRLNVARLAIEAMRRGVPAEQAVRDVVDLLARRLSMTGGVIGVDARGYLGAARNTVTMSYAAVLDGEPNDDLAGC